MLILLSPAKTMNMEPQERRLPSSRPRYEKEAEYLASEMRKFSAPQLGKLLKINDSLAQVNFERYQHFGSASNPEKQALFAYDGSVFRHIDPAGMTDDDLLYAQERLRIVSTLYGLVRPLDLIQAYRIAFTLRLGDGNGDLYDYWYPKLTEPLIETARKAGGIVINLASQDVMAALDTDRIRQQVGMIDAEFQEHRNGRYETVRTYAKMARGEMTRFILRNRIESPEGMKAFGWNGFAFDERLSSHEKIIFTREKK